ncbi:glycosyltransferase family 2 protein [Alicyclobacillus sp. ALC3]|nr:glycosyltransferase family 2 protein [Alicyclobacillus sp. ALC3]
MNHMSTFMNDFDFFLFLIFVLVYSYRVVYIFVAFKAKRSKYCSVNDARLGKYAVIIPARNEARVVGQLIGSIKDQNYPQDLVDIYVVADNCTDNTAQVARAAGAIVRERFNRVQVGKGYALDYMLKVIERDYSANHYDGYFVFDADNLLEENYIFEMNKTFDQGYRVVTSYRNSKNYDQNWITAGYALWFMHEAEYINLPRMVLNTSCAISGTGFLVQAQLLKDHGGWIYHLLTEDIEFSVSQVIQGEKIGYCRNAMFYDEQPITFGQSWSQRLRWAKGFYQVLYKYGKDLLHGVVHGKSRFSCYDMVMTIMPAMLISWVGFVWNGFLGLALLFGEKQMFHISTSRGVGSLLWSYGFLFLIGLITTITEWKKIHCANWKKIMYVFTFPIFMFTYLPISIVALFKKIEWKPIAHTVVKSMDDLR